MTVQHRDAALDAWRDRCIEICEPRRAHARAAEAGETAPRVVRDFVQQESVAVLGARRLDDAVFLLVKMLHTM